MDKRVGTSVLKDGEAATGTTDEKELKERIRKANKKAAGILLNSVLYHEKEGKAAFHLIEKFHDKDTGYVGWNNEADDSSTFLATHGSKEVSRSESCIPVELCTMPKAKYLAAHRLTRKAVI